MTSATVIRDGLVVTAEGERNADVLVIDERIAAIGEPGAVRYPGATRLSAAGLVVLPGVIDAHTHFVQDDPRLAAHDPDEHEGFTNGGRGAAAGGVTTVIEMPQARPAAVSGQALVRKRELAEADAVVDFALWGGVVPGVEACAVEDQLTSGAVAIKAFMCDSDPSYPGIDDAQLLQTLQTLAPTGVMLGVHAENDALLESGLAAMARAGRTDGGAHADSRPPIVELEAVTRAITLAEAVGGWIHIVHLSTGAAADAVAVAKARGVRVTCETCPQYLLLDRDDLVRLGSIARCAPPIRERSDVERLWQCLADGTIDAVTSDHVSYSWETRLRGIDDIFETPPGIPGVETLLPLVASEARRRGFGWASIARWTAAAPARLWHLTPQKGAIAVGSDADLTFIDPDEEWTVRGADLHHTHKWTPFEGCRVRGRVVRTLLRGKTVFDVANGQTGAVGGGRFLSRARA